jgi:iron(III) transport system permease protein
MQPQTIWYTAVLLVLLLLVVYPIALIVLRSFDVAQLGESSRYSIDAWRGALSDAGLLTAVWNTVKLTFAREAISFPIAVMVAWVLARTDIPGSHWLEFLFWVAFFLPALPVTLGWILLFDPKFGLVNQALHTLLGVAPFNIYGFWGIIWAHLANLTIAIKVMLLTPAFRNMDVSLEEASNMSGSSPAATIWRIMLPVMTPVLSVVLLLSTIYALQGFEVETVLGYPIRFFVFSTQIYFLIHQEHPQFASAMALSTMVLALMIPLIVLQRRVAGKRSYTTIGSRFRGGKLALGRWRRPAFAAVLGMCLTITVVPFIFLVMGTFMKLFGFFNLNAPWTTAHWLQVVHDPIFLRSVGNTLLLGLGTAAAALVLCTSVAYIVMRTRFAGRAALDLTSWLPLTIPGIILGLGLLSLFLASPLLRPLYGTIVVLIVATLVSTMTTSTQVLKANFAQLGIDLEEAARVGGGQWWHAFRYVLLPLLTPTLVLVGTISFISAARNVSSVALLATSADRPLSLLQLDLMVQGSYESAAVVGVIVVLLTTGIALAARVLGLRVSLAS